MYFGRYCYGLNRDSTSFGFHRRYFFGGGPTSFGFHRRCFFGFGLELFSFGSILCDADECGVGLCSSASIFEPLRSFSCCFAVWFLGSSTSFCRTVENKCIIAGVFTPSFPNTASNKSVHRGSFGPTSAMLRPHCMLPVEESVDRWLGVSMPA